MKGKNESSKPDDPHTSVTAEATVFRGFQIRDAEPFVCEVNDEDVRKMFPPPVLADEAKKLADRARSLVLKKDKCFGGLGNANIFYDFLCGLDRERDHLFSLKWQIETLREHAVFIDCWNGTEINMHGLKPVLFRCVSYCLASIRCSDENSLIDGWHFYSEASMHYGMALIHTGQNKIESIATFASALGYSAAMARLERDKDGKQAAKSFVKKCWDECRDRYATQSAFAMDMLDKIETNDKGEPIIAFDTILKKWIPEWRREAKETKK